VILVVGDLMLDVLLLPELRREEQYGGMLARSGGSAANTAAWMAHLGGEVLFVGCVGDDGVGRMLCDDLRAETVEVHARVVPGMETGCVAVNLDGAGERLMRSARGANVALDPDDIARVADGREVERVHLTAYAMLSTAGYGVLESAAGVAKTAGAVLSFDPSSVGAIDALGRERLLDAMTRSGVSVLLPNRIEALALSDTREVADAARALAEVVSTVIVKHGPEGALYVRDGQIETVPTDVVQPVDTTGAGDAFNAGALVALQRGATLYEACVDGNALARRAILTYGGRPAHALTAGVSER
jgi:sugar/nucleoside kinase (ribokinase family)